MNTRGGAPRQFAERSREAMQMLAGQSSKWKSDGAGLRPSSPLCALSQSWRVTPPTFCWTPLGFWPPLLPTTGSNLTLVVPRGDSVALAKAIAGLLDRPRLCRALGRRARRNVEQRFSIESVGRQLDEMLSQGAEEI